MTNLLREMLPVLLEPPAGQPLKVTGYERNRYGSRREASCYFPDWWRGLRHCPEPPLSPSQPRRGIPTVPTFVTGSASYPLLGQRGKFFASLRTGKGEARQAAA